MMTIRTWVIAFAGLALSACGQSGTSSSPNEDNEVLPGTESVKDFGDYVVYFNALTTDQLDAAIAAEYDIIRSNSRVLLNIVMEHSPDIGIPRVVPGEVKASARNLTGQLRNLDVREIREGESIYYIAETGIVDSESLIFAIEATPEGTATPLVVQFQKQFFVDN
jgi:hypothetical protein